jgi:hypothetical protein
MDSFEAMSKPRSGLPLSRVRCRNAASRAFWTVGEQSAGHYSATRYLPKPGISGRPFYKPSKPGSPVPVEKTWLDFIEPRCLQSGKSFTSHRAARRPGHAPRLEVAHLALHRAVAKWLHVRDVPDLITHRCRSSHHLHCRPSSAPERIGAV